MHQLSVGHDMQLRIEVYKVSLSPLLAGCVVRSFNMFSLLQTANFLRNERVGITAPNVGNATTVGTVLDKCADDLLTRLINDTAQELLAGCDHFVEDVIANELS